LERFSLYGSYFSFVGHDYNYAYTQCMCHISKLLMGPFCTQFLAICVLGRVSSNTACVFPGNMTRSSNARYTGYE